MDLDNRVVEAWLTAALGLVAFLLVCIVGTLVALLLRRRMERQRAAERHWCAYVMADRAQTSTQEAEYEALWKQRDQLCPRRHDDDSTRDTVDILAAPLQCLQEEMEQDWRAMEHLLVGAACALAQVPADGRARALWDVRRELHEGAARLRVSDEHDLAHAWSELAPALDREVASLLHEALCSAVPGVRTAAVASWDEEEEDPWPTM